MRRRSLVASFVAIFAISACGGAPAAAPTSAPAVSRTASTAPAVPEPATSSSADDASLGELELAVSGSPECQHRFRAGMLALHSFLYDQAHESFAAALAADPHCAMAAWGDAMAYDHFTQLGMWREVIPSNEHAYATSVAWEKAHGHTPSK